MRVDSGASWYWGGLTRKRGGDWAEDHITCGNACDCVYCRWRQYSIIIGQAMAMSVCAAGPGAGAAEDRISMPQADSWSD